MRHVIKKQCFDLTLHEKEEAFRIQQMVSDHYHRELVQIIENAFDDFSTPDHVIHIDKLEIDLGTISEKDIKKGRWKEIILKKIEEQLGVLRHKILSLSQVYLRSASLGLAEQWMFYMEFGFLPWNLIRPQPSWQMQAIECFATNSAAVEKLRSLMLRSTRAVERIIAQYEDKFLVIVAEVLSSRPQKKLVAFVAEFTNILQAIQQTEHAGDTIPYGSRSIRKYLWENIFSSLLSLDSAMATEEMAFHSVKSFFLKVKVRDKIPSRFFSGDTLSAVVLRRLRIDQDATNADHQSNTTSRHNETRKDHYEEKELIGKYGQRDRIVKKKNQNSDSVEEQVPDEIYEEEVDGIFVSDCGLVLLHPFLNSFFKRLDLLEGKSFCDLHAHQKALNLLYYLATGKTDPEEYQLVVPKILCAYPLQKPVESNVELSDEDKEECDGLLHSVIGHWDILKNTSPDGLRESFLQREGKLFIDQECFCFRVESQGIDILLDHLPWNISMIQLPWRKELIKVEWR